MGVRVLYDADEQKAALYDSVTDTAFGPLFVDGRLDGRELAEDFLGWCRDNHRIDTRMMTDQQLSSAVYAWEQARADEDNRQTQIDAEAEQMKAEGRWVG